MAPRKNANKKPKDLNAPKRPPSAYLLFNKARQVTLRPEHPDKKLTDLTKIVAQEWRTMTPEQKAPYDAEANAAKAKYAEDLEAYKKSDLFTAYQEKLEQWKIRQAREAAGSSGGSDSDDAPPPPRVMKKKPKDKNKPKKSLSAYFLFQMKRRKQLKEENPDKKITELTAMTGAEWGKLTDEQKEPYNTEAKELRTAYQARLAEYKESQQYKDYLAELDEWKQAQKAPPKKSPKKKKKVKSPSPAESESETGSSGSEESGSSSGEDDDGDTPMRDRRAESSSSGDEYSSDESD